MKLAVTYENGQIYQHFGTCPSFKIYDIENNQVIRSEIVESGPVSHGALVGLLDGLGVRILISGGIGMGAAVKLRDAGILLLGGCEGDADQNVADYLNGNLHYDPLAPEHHGPCHHGQEG